MLGLVVLAGCVPARLQLGLRLDAASSMQWSDSTLYLEGPDRSVVHLSAGRINEVWPGPARGLFAISTSEGVGVLLGRGAMIGGHLISEGSLVRSSRPETLWVAAPAQKPNTFRVIEWQGEERARQLFEVSPLLDFDVDAAGRLVLLTADQVVLLADGTHPLTPLPLTEGVPRPIERVFVDAAFGELVLYGGGKVARLDTGANRWSFDTIDLEREALVRHAWTRRVAIEPRFPSPAVARPMASSGSRP